MKKIAAIHDLSGYGRASLTVAIPILSYMGYQVCPLPTAILSAHSEYKDFRSFDLTDQMQGIIDHWKELDLHFDALYSGYLASEKQMNIVSGFFDDFSQDDNFILVDPVLGDHGKLYPGMDTGMITGMRELCNKANVITPNLTEAAFLLDGQDLYFSTDTELFEGSLVNYYLDDTIFAITWKEVHDGSVYTFSEVKVNHPSQFRRHLAGGEYGSATQFYTSEMAESVNAVVASSGDFYNFRNFGIIVYQGQVRKVEGTYAETCYIDRNGDLRFTYGGDITTTAAAKEYVAENDIWFSLGFGPVLIDNYEMIDHTWYGVGEITEGYARAALCQMGELHYIVATANTEGPWQDIPTVKTFAKNIAATGCRMAYCLDGGQTAAIVMGDQLINRPVYGQQRKISDIIYFATAMPEGG